MEGGEHEEGLDIDVDSFVWSDDLKVRNDYDTLVSCRTSYLIPFLECILLLSVRERTMVYTVQ